MFGVLTYKTTELFIKSLFNNGFNKTTESVYNNIQDILFYNPELQIIIEKYDIENKIKLFKIFLSEFNNLYKIKSIYIAIENVYQMIIIINSLLKKIKIILKDHTKMVLYKYRKPNYGDKIQKLELYCNLLNERFELFYKIYKIIQYNTDELNVDDKLINYCNPDYIEDPEISFILVPENTHCDDN